MAQFASIWAIKIAIGPNSDAPPHHAGDVIPVQLKSGGVKQVKLAQFLYATERKDGMRHAYYLPEAKEASA